MYILYSLLLGLSLFFYIPAYFFKRRLLRNEKLHLRERFGRGVRLPPHTSRALWIHAVSVGEVLSLQSLVRILKERHPDWTLYFSSLTSTGFQVAQKRLDGVDSLFFIPFDFGWIVRSYFRRIRPDLFILAESEFWPNLLREGARNTRGILLINGRISRESYRRFYRFRGLMKRILTHVRFFLVQTDADRERLLRVGIPASHVEVAGNLKADVDLPVLADDDLRSLKNGLNIPDGRILLLAGSVHREEDVLVVESFSRARDRRQELAMIIAPRHLDRAGTIEERCQQLGLKTSRRTSARTGVDWDVLILDTMGELAMLYAVCHISFIGGSLVPWGGQNLLEPAFYGKPLFYGPHMENFAVLSERFIEAGAARLVRDGQVLSDLLASITMDEMLSMGSRARDTLHSLRGATEKTLRIIEDMITADR